MNDKNRDFKKPENNFVAPIKDHTPLPTKLDYGDMNEEDAIKSGYTKDGHAVSKTKTDKEGVPTGAYTDVGAGRSSVVRKN